MANHLRHAGARPRPCLPPQGDAPSRDSGDAVASHSSPPLRPTAPTWEELLGRR